MTEQDAATRSAEHGDADTNTSNNSRFESVMQTRLSRRNVLRGTAGAAALAALAAAHVKLAAAENGHQSPQLNFTPVAKNLNDAVSVPPGYRYDVLYRLGDPIARGVSDYSNNGTDDPASFQYRAGDHHDGIQYLGLGPNGRYHKNSSDGGLLVMNHEAITPTYLHPTGQTIQPPGAITSSSVRTVPDEVLREFYVHGVSIIEVAQGKRRSRNWEYVQNSRFNRRIHTLTTMELSGPAARAPYTVTKFSPSGTKTRGTVNNCAQGTTPWGTYLTCEENWAGYFRRITATDNPLRTQKELASFSRYGVAGNGRELWATVTPDTPDNLYGRWNAAKLGSSTDGSDDYRNVVNTFGWVIETDPFDPNSVPRKRTALGRFAHEGASLGPVQAGDPLVWYLGDDSRNEYIYKYVSNRGWNPSDANGGLASGDKYLNDGKLYVARFLPDGSGQWIELKFGFNGITPDYAPYPFADQADVLINARHAADAAGATKMDRPEWAAVNPINGEVYFTLTNNAASSRAVTAVDAANPRFYNDKRTDGTDQKGNPNGHIIRLAEDGDAAGALSFTWDVFLFGARATADVTNVNLSGLSDANDFSSPDGCSFSLANPGLLWIETDDGAITDITNCMLLAAIPGQVGDGASRSVTSVDGATSKTVTTYVGKAPGDEKLRRFLVGPKECEITGITETPDGKTLFVNIQHPGENTVPDFATSTFGSHWPDGGSSRPRSATIAITREDGGDVGID